MFSWQLAEIVHFCFLSIFIYFILINENVLFKILKYNTYWNIIIQFYYDEPHLKRYIHLFDKFQYILICMNKMYGCNSESICYFNSD